jgi:hypothetical protein
LASTADKNSSICHGAPVGQRDWQTVCRSQGELRKRGFQRITARIKENAMVSNVHGFPSLAGSAVLLRARPITRRLGLPGVWAPLGSWSSSLRDVGTIQVGPGGGERSLHVAGQARAECLCSAHPTCPRPTCSARSTTPGGCLIMLSTSDMSCKWPAWQNIILSTSARTH